MRKRTKNNKTVLVAILKNTRDLKILLQKKWYHIPVKTCPKIKFKWVAFYQPVLFKKNGKRIKYYGKVRSLNVAKRIDLFPEDFRHRGANDDYFKINFSKINELDKPIKNIIPRRVCFGFTTLECLLKSKDILQLYSVAPTEQIVQKALKSIGIKTKTQYSVIKNSRKRYRLDLVIFCKNGCIAVECDNKKAHSSKIQKQKDKSKDAFLRRKGWTVVRFTEQKIISNLNDCIKKVQKGVNALGGLLK